MTLSWKLLFIMLNRNDLTIKFLLALYLVSIYFSIYLYVCTYMYHEYSYSWCVYMFLWFPCYLGLTVTTSFFLSPILIFNMTYWLYLKLLPVQDWCTVIRLCDHTVYWLGFLDWYMYGYMYWRENDLVMENTLLLYFRREMTSSWNSSFLLILFQLPFRSDMLLSSTPFIV